MTKINLLPWRIELRKKRNNFFYVILCCVVAVSMVLVMVISNFINYRISVQTANVEYISKELLGVKSEITEIEQLQASKAQFLERMYVIEELQTDRFTIVRLLDMLPRVLPEGIYLTEVARELPGDETSSDSPTPVSHHVSKKYTVRVKGIALTNGSISILLRNLGEIKWITNIKLNEVSINKSNNKAERDMIEGLIFQVEFIQHVGIGK